MTDRVVGGSRVMIRRLYVLPFIPMVTTIGIALWSVGRVVTGHGSLPDAFTPITLTAALLFYFCGPAAYVTVTSDAVTVGNPLRRHVVPRSLIESVVGVPPVSIGLRVRGRAERLSIAALSPVSRTGWVPQSTYDRSLGRFRRALRDVPESGLAGELTSRWRWVHVAPLLLLLLADVTAFVVLTQHHVWTGSG